MVELVCFFFFFFFVLFCFVFWFIDSVAGI